MNTPATGLLAAISPLAPHFRQRTWAKAVLLIRGAVLCPGSRTVTNILRTLALERNSDFAKFHRVLSRAPWSAKACGLTLLGLLVRTFAHCCCSEAGPLVFAVDETIERRWGARITKRGIYRDAARSSHSHFVKCSGLRWMSLMLVTALPWTGGVAWALPVLTVLCPSGRYYAKRTDKRGAKKLTDFARQLIGWLGRHVVNPTTGLGRACVLVGDSSYSTYELMHAARTANVALVSRMRLDARLFHFPPARKAGQRGRPPVVGNRLLSMAKRLTDGRCGWAEVTLSEWYGHGEVVLEWATGTALWYKAGTPPVPVRWVLLRDPAGVHAPVLLASSQQAMSAEWIVRAYVRRWRAEVTFAEVRRHLGVESQRQWSDLAIERTTPALMALKSITCLAAVGLHEAGRVRPLKTAWYRKSHVTFSDVLAAVREQLWSEQNGDLTDLTISPLETDIKKLQGHIAWMRMRMSHIRRILASAAA